MKLKLLSTTKMSAGYRKAAVDVDSHRLLVTNFKGTEQEKDFSEPANCAGLGRIRHFRRHGSENWPLNPLPIDPACRALGLNAPESIRAQVFQNAVCNWRCWYCFVDFELLSANRKHSQWVGPGELVELYLNQPYPPPMIDLTGGQPDLTPEWIPWMMTELRERGLQENVYLWSDDNLSNDYFWTFLTDADRELVAEYKMYGRVCCFKGFNAESFSFNTRAEPELFNRQFELMSKLLSLGIDLYAYVTLTSPSSENIARDVGEFVDRLQAIDVNLPLRTVPLEVKLFTPVVGRMDDSKERALANQHVAITAWTSELIHRFTDAERARNIVDVPMGPMRGMK